MVRFDSKYAIFGALAARLRKKPEDTVFTYSNKEAASLYGQDFLGMSVTELFYLVLGSKRGAKESFDELMSEGSVVLEGKLNEREVQVNSIVDFHRSHLQTAIMDTTCSMRAQEGFVYTAGALARASEANDEVTGRHIARINDYSRRLADMLSMDSLFVDNIGFLAQLHDVGKIHVSAKILRKPGPLTVNEFEIMKEHTLSGAVIIGAHGRLKLAREIAIAHHENFDGSGYPYGLAGEKIPISARIVKVVDVFDALVSERPYKSALSYEEARRIMVEGNDRVTPRKDFDPRILDLFLENFDDFIASHTHFQGESFAS